MPPPPSVSVQRSAGILILLGCVVALAAADAAHAFICADSGRKRIARFAVDGRLEWEVPAGNTYDVWQLPEGHVLFSTGRGAREVASDGRTVFDYQVKGEAYACQRLPDGRTLVGECTAGRIVEVAPDGTVAKAIATRFTKGGHVAMRMVRKTAAGTYLVAHLGDCTVREYDGAGTVLREIPLPGLAYKAVRLPDGNTLCSWEKGLREVDANGQVTWEVTAADLEGAGIQPRWLTGFQRLADGTTIVPNWFGHGRSADGVAIFAITRDKRITWRCADQGALGSVTQVQILDAGAETDIQKLLR